MARINIEDAIFKDKRFAKLRTKLGEREALGALIEAWFLAQHYWRKNKCIPKDAWKKQEMCDELIAVGLVEDRGEEGYYAKGSTKQFSWISETKERMSVLGKKSAEARKKKNGSAIPSNASNKPNVAPNEEPNVPNSRSAKNRTSRTSPSPSPSPSPSQPLTQPQSHYKKKSAAQPKLPSAPNGASEVIAKYCDAWKARYKSDRSPAILPQHAKSIKQLVTSVGIDRALSLVDAYLQMPDSWFLTKRHDIPTLMGNLNPVGHFLEKGTLLTKKDIRGIEDKVNSQQLFNMIDEGKI